MSKVLLLVTCYLATVSHTDAEQRYARYGGYGGQGGTREGGGQGSIRTEAGLHSPDYSSDKDSRDTVGDNTGAGRHYTSPAYQNRASKRSADAGTRRSYKHVYNSGQRPLHSRPVYRKQHKAPTKDRVSRPFYRKPSRKSTHYKVSRPIYQKPGGKHVDYKPNNHGSHGKGSSQYREYEPIYKQSHKKSKSESEEYKPTNYD